MKKGKGNNKRKITKNNNNKGNIRILDRQITIKK